VQKKLDPILFGSIEKGYIDSRFCHVSHVNQIGENPRPGKDTSIRQICHRKLELLPFGGFPSLKRRGVFLGLIFTAISLFVLTVPEGMKGRKGRDRSNRFEKSKFLHTVTAKDLSSRSTYEHCVANKSMGSSCGYGGISAADVGWAIKADEPK